MAQIYKRGKVYWGRIQRDGREHRQSLKTASRAVAEKRLREWVDELEATAWGTRLPPTYKEAVVYFMENHLPDLKLQAARRYRTSLRVLLPHFDACRLDKITRAELTAFEVYRKREGASQATIRRDLACLSSLIEEAISAWGFLAGFLPMWWAYTRLHGRLQAARRYHGLKG